MTADVDLLNRLFFLPKEKENTMEPKKIEWVKGEPTDKLNAAPDGAPCIVVREWTDDKGRLQRETREGYVALVYDDTRRFVDVRLWPEGFTETVVSVTVTLPVPEWADDRWVLYVYRGGVTGYADQLSEHARVTLAKQVAEGKCAVIRLPESVQDALDEAGAR